jgi:hypothetical protein
VNWFAQEKYNETVGNGPFKLSQIGCFVTSFSNLLERYGEPVDPNVLNVFFTEHNVYLPDPMDGAGVKDDLAWGSITAYDHTITVKQTGAGSWPNSNDAIIEFRFNQNGQEITHFCLVNDVATKTIVDSWDGQVKEPGIYGAPVAWAAYERNVPQPVPVPHPNSNIVIPPPNYDGESVTIQAGWGLSNAAQAAGYPDAGNESRWQAIAVLNGQSDWDEFNKSLKPGERIKVGRYEVPANQPTVQHQENGVKVITVQPGWGLERVAAAAGRSDANLPECWQEITSFNGGTTWQSYNAHLQPGQQVKVPPRGFHGEGENQTPPFMLDKSKAGTLNSLIECDVHDLNNPLNEVKPLPAGQPVAVAGTFSCKGKTYYLPQFAASSDTWYGIPENVFVAPAPKKTAYDRFLIAVGSVVGLLKRKKVVAKV